MNPKRMNSDKAVSRRGFLRGAAAAALAGPAIVPSRVLGAGAPSKQIAMGMIGMGRQTWGANLPPFLKSNDAVVVAVCDVDSWRLEQARARVENYYAGQARTGGYKGCMATRDFREVLARDDIDAVMIATPDHWHAPIGILAAKAGKDVCVEKPLTISPVGGRALCDAVKKHGRISRTDSEFRSIRSFSRAVELVRHGFIGKLHTIRTGVPHGSKPVGSPPEMPVPAELDYNMWLGPAAEAPYTEKRVHTPKDLYARPGWMRTRDYCNGMISNWGTHLNDIAQWGNDTERTGPVEVEGTGEFTEGLWNTIVEFEVKYRYANGVQLIYKTESPYVRFEGDEGWIMAEYSGRKLTASSQKILDARLGPDQESFETTDEKTDFLNAVKSRKESLEPVEVGHRTVSLCQIGLIAIERGKKLNWDPDAERFANDDAANAMLGRTMRAPWTLNVEG